MINTVQEQPGPRPTDREPTWRQVRQYLADNYEDVSALLSDMAARDKLGVERYGVPLTSGNGRDQLLDLYQELLDGCVYARAWLDEQGINPDGTKSRPRDLSAREALVVGIFKDLVDTLVDLREALGD